MRNQNQWNDRQDQYRGRNEWEGDNYGSRENSGNSGWYDSGNQQSDYGQSGQGNYRRRIEDSYGNSGSTGYSGSMGGSSYGNDYRSREYGNSGSGYGASYGHGGSSYANQGAGGSSAYGSTGWRPENSDQYRNSYGGNTSNFGGMSSYDRNRNYGQGSQSNYGQSSYGQSNYGQSNYGQENYGMGGSSYGSGSYSGSNYGNTYDRGSNRAGYDRDYDRRKEDRGFWEKAGDEVSSWFGDDEARRRRERDHRQDSNYGTSGYGSSSYGSYGQHRGKGPRNYKRSDDRIKEDLNDRLSDDDMLDASDIDVEVNSCEVTLTGTVDSRMAKRRAEDLAESISGVSNVENRLRVRTESYAGSTSDNNDSGSESRRRASTTASSTGTSSTSTKSDTSSTGNYSNGATSGGSSNKTRATS